MSETILITGSTDGLGLATATALATAGHHVILHGRSDAKLTHAKTHFRETVGAKAHDAYLADLSTLEQSARLADRVAADHPDLSVVINNAGVLKATNPRTRERLDVRFAVNTFAPVVITDRLLAKVPSINRVLNLSSAAQQTEDVAALQGQEQLFDQAAYAMSKLALTIWTQERAKTCASAGPALVAINPGSLLATKMVQETFAIAGNDINQGVDILVRATTTDEFTARSGQYFDGDAGDFAPAHTDTQDPHRCAEVMAAIDATVSKILS